MWTLTYSVHGVKVVETVPSAWVARLRPLIKNGKAWHSAVAEVRAINAQLFTMYKRDLRKRKKTKSP